MNIGCRIGHVEGYPAWTGEKETDGFNTVYIHQLIAIHNGGDPSKIFSNGEYHCHHKNGCKFDNRPSNIEVMTVEEHNSIHYDYDVLRPDAIDEGYCSKIRELYKSGESMGDISRNEPICKSTVRNHLSGECKHNVDDITPGLDGPREGPWRNGELFEEKYVNEGMSMKALAREWGCTDKTVRVWRDKHGLV